MGQMETLTGTRERKNQDNPSIGTTTPTTKLDVNGTITATQVSSTDGMQDPVFKPYRILHRIEDSCKLCECKAFDTIFRAELLKNQERPL